MKSVLYLTAADNKQLGRLEINSCPLLASQPPSRCLSFPIYLFIFRTEATDRQCPPTYDIKESLAGKEP